MRAMQHIPEGTAKPVSGLGGGAAAAGWAGLLPFAAALACVALAPDAAWRAFGVQLALVWGAVILAFVAAVHWGLALAGRWRWDAGTILGSVLPSVLGAAAVLQGGTRGIALLVAGFGAFWLYEHRRRGEDLPADYLALRRALTLTVVALLAVTAIAAGPDA